MFRTIAETRAEIAERRRRVMRAVIDGTTLPEEPVRCLDGVYRSRAEIAAYVAAETAGDDLYAEPVREEPNL